MKLSELKETVIAIRGKEKWEEIENSKIFKIYMAPEEEQLKIVQRDGCCIKFIKNPSEKVQLEAVKKYGYVIGYIDNPSEELIDYIIHNKNLEIIKYTLRHIENDLIEKTFKLSELRNKTLEEIKDLLNKYLLNK